MRTAQRTDTFQGSDFVNFPVLRPEQLCAVSEIAFAKVPFLGNSHDVYTIAIKPVRNGFAIIIINADNCRVARRHQTFLDRGIVFH